MLDSRKSELNKKVKKLANTDLAILTLMAMYQLILQGLIMERSNALKEMAW
jgi:hypothetical protein